MRPGGPSHPQHHQWQPRRRRLQYLGIQTPSNAELSEAREGLETQRYDGFSSCWGVYVCLHVHVKQGFIHLHLHFFPGKQEFGVDRDTVDGRNPAPPCIVETL